MLSSWRICCGRLQQRWIMAVMSCLAITNAYMMRVCLSLAITEMVATVESSANNTSSQGSCPITTDSTSSSSSNSGTYEWDEYTQGIILSSFYWGYIITQLPGGILADKFGGKHTLGLGILSTALFSVVTPVSVEIFGARGLIILRLLMGFCEGTTFPAVSVLIARWAPPLERSKITSVVMSGIAIGTVLGNALSGFLIEYSSMGWPIIFYTYGGLGILWFIVWVILCYSSPESHPFITAEEKKYLHEMTAEHTHQQHTQPIPWRHMVTSAPVWALFWAKVGFSWGFYVVLTDLPKYMSDVLNFSIEANGLLSALPYVVLWIVGGMSSIPADWLMNTHNVSRTNVRKLFHGIASVFPAIFIIAASYAGCDGTAVAILFTIAVGTMSPYYITVMVNPNDLSPNYTGTLMAVVNSAGALSGILVPYVAGLLTPNHTLLEWRIVFWITFVLFVVTAVIFAIWADGEVQYWNDLDSWLNKQKEVKDEKKAHGVDGVISPFKIP